MVMKRIPVHICIGPLLAHREHHDFLQQQNIITNKRGIGYFTEDDAMERILAFRREQFIENELPVFMRNIFLLKMDFKEIKAMYDQFVKENFKK